MSSFVDRLRGVVKPRPRGPVETGVESAEPFTHVADETFDASSREDAAMPGVSRRGGSSGPHGCADAADVLDGEWHERRGQRFVIVERTYPPGHRHGRLAVADALPPADDTWPRLPLLAGTSCSGRMLFVDVETTGLAGGAGSYAFLVGCAWFDGGVFRVRQFFLASFASERALLEAVADTAAAAGTVVTYNGKTFDMPLMETRFVMHRMETPFASVPHVDMLHPARRLWRTTGDAHRVYGVGEDEPDLRGSGMGSGHGSVGDGGPVRRSFSEGGCRLSVLEDLLCGHRREGDVPGFEIPSRYFHYVRSGDARPLSGVLEHNRLDLLALALVTGHAAQLLDDGPAAARSPREALGMGRLYERAGWDGDACAAFERAAAMRGADPSTRAEALRAFAVLSRRQRRHDEAAAAWQTILELRGAPPGIVREATEALAVHHEHRLRDPRSARTLALRSMKLPQTVARRAAIEHRLARLERKLGTGSPSAPSLFGAT